MRSILAGCLMIGLVAAAPAAAQTRPDTRALSCADVNALIQQRGAVVMSTGQYTYRRFVATAGYCQRFEVRRVAWVPAKDRAQCPVRWVCHDVTRPHGY